MTYEGKTYFGVEPTGHTFTHKNIEKIKFQVYYVS